MEYFVLDFTAEIFIILAVLCSILLWKGRKEELLSVPMTDEMKGFAILLVFAVHSLLQPKLLGYGGYGVGLFLFLSGYGLFCSDKLKCSNPWQFAIKRIKRIMPAFIAYLAIFTLVWAIYPSFAWPVLGGHQPSSPISFIYSIFAFSHIWYIGFLFFWYLAYFLLLKNNFSTQVKIGIIWLFGILLIVLRPFEIGDPLRIFHEWFVYVLCFPLGVLVAYHHKKIQEIASNAFFNPGITRGAACIAAFLMVAAISWFSQKMGLRSLHYPLTSLLFVIGTIMVWEFFLKFQRSKLLGFLGKVSYEVYLFHYLVIVVTNQILNGMSINNELVTFLLSFGISIMIAYAIKWGNGMLLREMPK